MTNLDLYEKSFNQALSLDKLPKILERGKITTWDSIGHMHLITEIEDTFEIMFDTEDIIGFTSYEKGKEILKNYGIEI